MMSVFLYTVYFLIAIFEMGLALIYIRICINVKIKSIK